MGESIDGDCREPGVAKDDFVGAFAGRVTIKSGLHVGEQVAPNVRESFEKFVGELPRFSRLFFSRVRKGLADQFRQEGLSDFEVVNAYFGGGPIGLFAFAFSESGEEDGSKRLNERDQVAILGESSAAGAGGFVGRRVIG